ncbi:hypothetical protein SAMD00023353_13300020 [Rosellinia necatrix]|uniref:AB hydrolase-1 domain-containing protein n=1 Tax=Rosellinia necatrix TaxID=77044 RepID=A0A1W2TXM6_ROSNE|nr:hypothetical protein SAMD00023353_13300020 [Rosellinia necatrix]
MSKPFFVLSTGSFAPPAFYDNLVDRLGENGYEMKVLHLPSVGRAAGEGRDTPPGTMYEDAALIAKEVEALADAGKEVILVAHSYGGMPATESTKGLSVQERLKQGKKGGLVRLAYKTVLLTNPGHSASDVLGTPPFQPDENGWLHMPDDLEISAATCFSDLPREEGVLLAAQFALHSAVSFTNSLTHAGYKDVPVSYLVCEKDLIISPDVQRKGIDMIEAETGSKVDVTSIDAGHCPTGSMLDTVVEWLVGVARRS